MIRIVVASLALLGMGCFDSLVALQCEENLTECPNGCTDTRYDPQNCGGCGVVCMSTCNDGICTSAGGGDDVVPGVVLFPRPTDPTPIP